MAMKDVMRAYERGETKGFMKILIDRDNKQILGYGSRDNHELRAGRAVVFTTIVQSNSSPARSFTLRTKRCPRALQLLVEFIEHEVTQ
jgi:hypothetical protein